MKSSRQSLKSPSGVTVLCPLESEEMPSEQPELEAPKKTAHDMYGHLIGLRFAITEILNEATVDMIQENPRTVLMALRGLEAQAKELVAVAKGEIEAGK